jgi:hypothetical protein
MRATRSRCAGPFGVEIYRLVPDLLEGWSTPHVAAYKGQHGLTLGGQG